MNEYPYEQYRNDKVINHYCLIECGNGTQTGVIVCITDVGTLVVRKWIVSQLRWSEEVVIHPRKVLKLSDCECTLPSFESWRRPPERQQLFEV